MENLIEIYQSIFKKNCLCPFSSNYLCRMLYDPLSSSLESSTGFFEKDELLWSSIVREISETYIEQSFKKSSACKVIFDFINKYHEDKAWNEMINLCNIIKDKYVQYNLIKAVTALTYTLPTVLMKARLKNLLDCIQKSSSELELSGILEIFISLLSFDLDSFTMSDENCTNCVCVPCTISYEEVLPIVCTELLKNWDILKSLLLKEDHADLNNFLLLWNQLIGKTMKNGSFSSSQDMIMDFFRLSTKLPPISLQLYINIISQIICSSYNSVSFKSSDNSLIEKAVLQAVENRFLESISISNSSLTFCCAVNSLPSCSCEPSIVLKKSLFVLMNLLMDFKSVSSIYAVIESLQLSIECLTGLKSSNSDYSFIVDLFIGEDDLLFGSMLTFLRIYIKFKDQELGSCEIIEKLNPHIIFAKFLKQIGFDHTELLSFLTSDETCCLLYLLTYVKLLLRDFDAFVRVHEPADCTNSESEIHNQIQSHSFTVENVTTKASSNSSCLSLLNNATLYKPRNRKLVLYSSSSSSDENDVDTKCATLGDKTKDSKTTVNRTLAVFINLKESMQKLLDINEFPYNISPLVLLLSKIEKISYH